MTTGRKENYVTMTQDKNERTENLGLYLGSLRKKMKMSLREVEEASDRNVSNAYLSQLENGKILKPAPDILHSLSEVYQVPYESLMKRAGYLPTTKRTDAVKHGIAATFSVDNLSVEEEKALLEYLNFIRSTRKDTP